ncbi:MAG: DNA polymerase III subunit gamma/tau [Rhizobiales bacterium]|nr:DNA polymerase III subunit gamma/tau [Hyphomicrobiales bacterium]NRB14219.1 DNA polymerase III subunit gamma/tau [Hyphomicrobiales bacterium]
MSDDKPKPKPQAAYQVLARKYRPHNFEDMIGHDAMVQTLQNAFETGRIAQAYILTGVRGIGKTTTARILARALNYELADGSVTKPTTIMPKLGIHCQDIMDSRHIDVFEMDAASRTGIGDIREIIESVRYKPVDARYKVYIIDEVHMLTTAAFNGLLKTLEEPPEHVKFIFATTEIQKIPVTVLSRCQRFDLRRIDAQQLKDLFAEIAVKEGVKVSDDALAIIAQASEGSARDGLSILDQAIAMAGGAKDGVSDENVRQMLGIADRMRIFDLFENLMQGKLPEALAEFKNQYDEGADPLRILAELAEISHWITRLKVIENLQDNVWSKEAHDKGNEFAAKLSMRSLAKAWQMLLKGMDEVKNAPKPFAAAEMALIRLGYGAQLPNPDDVIKKLIAQKAQTGAASPQSADGTPASQPQNNGGTSGVSAISQSVTPQSLASEASNSTTNLLSFPPSNTATAVQMQPSAISEPTPEIIDQIAKDNVVELRPEPAKTQNDLSQYADNLSIDSDQNDDAAFYDIAEAAPSEFEQPYTKNNGSATASDYIYSPNNFEDLVILVRKQRELLLSLELLGNVLLISYKIGEIHLKPLPQADKNMPKQLMALLSEWTGENWLVTFDPRSQSAETTTLREKLFAKKQIKLAKFSQEDLIKYTLAQFDGAIISEIIDLNDMD